ncbi:MAG: hypothetical protein GDA41_00305 [Rhodospirillales bacterium]|nr:hypothetical protein [Rhodospirillales bacterium]
MEVDVGELRKAWKIRANWLTIAKKWAIVEGGAFSLDALESLPREWSGEASRFFCTYSAA